MKKILALLFAFLCLLGTACKTKVNEDTITLNIWIQTVNQPYYFSWVKQEFEKENVGIKLNITPQSPASLNTALDSTLAGAESPDIASTWGGAVVPTLVAGKRILELDDVIDAKVKGDMQELAFLNQTNNKFYCAPLYGFASPMIFYNKTFYDAKQKSEKPTTYASLKDWADTARAWKKSPLVTGYDYHFMQALHARTLTDKQLDAIIAKPSADHVNPFDNEGTTNGFELVKRMTTDRVFHDNITGMNTKMAFNSFTSGESAMIALPSLELYDLAGVCNFEIGAFVLPDFSDISGIATVKPSSLLSGIFTDALVVGAQTKYPAECKKLISFLYSSAAQDKLYDFYLLPVLKTAKSDHVNDAPGYFNSVFKEIAEQVQKDGMTLFYMSYFAATGLDGELDNLFKGVINGGIQPSGAKNALVAKWNQLI